jgi:nucleotide-binding universal stress UspA family protein
MGDTPAFKYIVWAVDVFEKNRRMHRLAARTLKEIIKRTGAIIDPVYVLELDDSDIPFEFNDTILKNYRDAASKALKQLITETGLNHLPQCTQGHILTEDLYRLRFDSRVSLLTHYAASVGADAILVPTHGRSGIKRVILGSFAETLLLRSPLPILTVSPFIKKIYPWNRILFPTDLNQGAKPVLGAACAVAQEFKSQLFVYHCFSPPFEPILQSSVYLLSGSWVPLFPHFGQAMDQKIQKLRAWKRWLTKKGVNAEYVVHTATGSTYEAILDFAKEKKASLIVMEQKSGAISSALLGSLVRQIVRHAPCPVLTLHSSQIVQSVAKKFAA